MGRYYRNFKSGGTFFFTVVTEKRQQFLTTDLARQCLRRSFHEIRSRHPFEIIAIALLPDHLHSVWTLPDNECDFSLRWRKIKETFTRSFLASGGTEVEISASRKRHGCRGIWQDRFWEHTCRDEQDLRRCVDYIHWNPVKHELVDRARDYPYSSFHRFVRLGEYEWEWGKTDPCPGVTYPE